MPALPGGAGRRPARAGDASDGLIAAEPGATPPTIYGTTDVGHGLARALTITVNVAFTTTEVSVALFNGETFAQGDQVDAFNGNALVVNAPVPEPHTWALLLAGGALLGWRARRQPR